MPQRRTRAAEVARAIEVFVRGFCLTRSFTHPYVGERVEGVWVIRDAPRRRGDYRNEEWITHDVPPEDVDRIARGHTRGRFSICALHWKEESDEALREGYKRVGYRLMRTEPMMVHRLARISRCESPAKVERVMTQGMADRLAKAARARQVLAEHLKEDAPLRQYVALVQDDLVGWVRSIVVGDATWCSTMYVVPEHRRKGIARAMLCRMLRDDRSHGARQAVLLASHAGAMLYPVVGYERIGTLLLFAPKRR